jgi:choline dehydrogenase-like flavoprotein
LPYIQKNYGTDALKIIAGFEVDKLHAKGKTITKVSGRFKDGRKINVSAEKIVLSAGAISSSLILLKSNAGNDQVGKHLGFNLGSPITAIFDKPVNAFEGLQISHYLVQKPSQGYVMETWFNPPVAQALTMPGWFDDHFNNMLRYNRLSCVGILVPTESNAVVRDGGLFRRDIKYVPTENDLKKLGEGLILGAEIFLAGGAKAVMPHTMDFLELTKDELTVIRKKVLEEGQMTLGTGHPQGGNKMCRKPEQGVIDPHFKVYGYDNLFICDASVFPCSIGVNPQLTVMALAHYASTFIAQ